MNLLTRPPEGAGIGVFKGLGGGPISAEGSTVFRRLSKEGLGFTSGRLKVRPRSAPPGGGVWPSWTAYVMEESGE